TANQHEQRPVGFPGSLSPACSSSSRRSATHCWRPPPRRPHHPSTSLAVSPPGRNERLGKQWMRPHHPSTSLAVSAVVCLARLTVSSLTARRSLMTRFRV